MPCSSQELQWGAFSPGAGHSFQACVGAGPGQPRALPAAFHDCKGVEQYQIHLQLLPCPARSSCPCCPCPLWPCPLVAGCVCSPGPTALEQSEQCRAQPFALRNGSCSGPKGLYHVNPGLWLPCWVMGLPAPLAVISLPEYPKYPGDISDLQVQGLLGQEEGRGWPRALWELLCPSPLGFI